MKENFETKQKDKKGEDNVDYSLGPIEEAENKNLDRVANEKIDGQIDEDEPNALQREKLDLIKKEDQKSVDKARSRIEGAFAGGVDREGFDPEETPREVGEAKLDKDEDAKSAEDKDSFSDAKMSRRTFLKIAGTAAGSAALGPFAKTGESFAGLKETLEFDNVKEGSQEDMVEELYREVFEDEKEIARFYFESSEKFKTKGFFKGKTKKGWFEGKGIEYSESSVLIAPKNFEVLMKDPSKIEKVSFFHTHPAAAIENINEQLKENVSARDLLIGDHEEEQRNKERMALPFSEADFNVFMNVCMEYPQAAEMFSMDLLEPTGHWKIEIDSENETIENFKRMQKEYEQEADKFNKLGEEEKNEYRKKATLIFMEENRDSGLSELRGILSDKNAIFTTFKEREEYFSKLKTVSEIAEKMILCKNDEEREESAAKIKDELGKLGLKVDYTQMHPPEKKREARLKIK